MWCLAFCSKAYAIFCPFVCFTFYIQTQNQKRGGKTSITVSWRMVLLVGFAHVECRILSGRRCLVAVRCGESGLVLTRNWRDKAILITAIIFLLQPVEWYHYLAALADPAHRLPDLKWWAKCMRKWRNTRNPGTLGFHWVQHYVGAKASLLWAVNAGRFSRRQGCSCWALHRKKTAFVSSEKNLHLWVKILIVSALSFAPLYTLKELVMGQDAIVQHNRGYCI